jgi:hypothetical protein
MPAVTGSWRKSWLPYRSPDSMRCWWPLNWYWKSGTLSAEHVLNVVARLVATGTTAQRRNHLQLKEAPTANTARYDRLRGRRRGDPSCVM